MGLLSVDTTSLSGVQGRSQGYYYWHTHRISELSIGLRVRTDYLK